MTTETIVDPRKFSAGASGLSRRERRKLEVQNKICQAAISLFESQGTEPTTVEEICELADVARKTFYNYYPSKQDLIRVLCDMQLFSRTEELLQSVLDQGLGTAESLRLYLSQAQEDLAHYGAIDRLLIREAMLDASPNSRASQHFAQLVVGFTELVTRGQAKGDVKDDYSPAFYAEVILSTINGMLTAWMSHDGYPINQRLDDLTEFLINSICKKRKSKG